MADNPIRKTYEAKYSPPAERKESAPKQTEKQKRLWQALADFIHESGGYLVSSPGEKFLRIEIPSEPPSALAGKLQQLGYDVRATGIGTRIEGGDFMRVEMFTFPLPVK